MNTAMTSSVNSTAPASMDVLAGAANVIAEPETVEGAYVADTASAAVVTSKSTGGASRRGRVIGRSPLRFHPAPSKGREFISLARWEGAVTERFASYFVAELIDLDTGEQATAEFELDKVKSGDLNLCEPGALFYWSVGYEVRQGGTRVRASDLRFRRVGTAANRV